MIDNGGTRVPGIQHNPQLLLSAFLRIARKQDDPPEWIESLQAAALTGSSEQVSSILDKMQDQYATVVRSDAGNTEWIRGLDCLLIAQLCEAALQVLEKEAADEEADLPAGPAGSVRHADFGCYPSILG